MRRTSNAPCESNAEGPCAFLSDTLAQSLFLFCVMTVLNRFIGFCRGILMCRWLEPAELGQWDMVQGFLMLAAPVAGLGIRGIFGSYLGHYRQRGQLRMLFGRTLLVCCGAAILAVLVMWSAAGLFSYLIFG